jgi:small-conductance mechanosensitive channel
VRESLTQGLLTTLGAAALALVVGWLTGVVIHAFERKQRYRWFLRQFRQHCMRSWKVLLFVLALYVALPHAARGDRSEHTIRHILLLAVICASAWFVVRVLFVAEDTISRLFPIDVPNNRRVRRMRTQIALLRRLTAAIISVLALGAVLTTFAPLRTFGASLLASAGIIGIIGGLAAQTTLSHVFAGLQLAFTDTLRLEDAVVVEGEWGYIEELRLTHVVLRLWDERRLVLPTTYFTQTPFQNWTRNEARVLGSVTLHLDYAAPVTLLRGEARRIVESSPFSDHRDVSVQVVDTTETTMVVRILASAPDAPNAWDLRCQLREDLLTYLQINHPESLPVTRARLTEPPSEHHEEFTLTR